jgi:hypothetical protein
MKKETDNPLNEEDDKNMDIFEEELLKIVAKSKLTPLGVAALLLKNAVTIYSTSLDKESMQFLMDFAMENYVPSEDVGKNTIH